MALKIFTKTPSALLNKIKAGINDGSVATWSFNSQNLFDHTPKTWTRLARLQITVHDGYLQCNVLYPDGMSSWPNKAAYGVYQGRFAEMLLNHFLSDFVFIASGDWGDVKNLTYAPTTSKKAA